MILIASDHAGFELKQYVIHYLKDMSLEYQDLGCNSTESVDYPDYAYKLAKLISVVPDGGANSTEDRGYYENSVFGILICGTGIGMSIAANRFSRVRAALCTSGLMAKLSREHNDANVLVLGARIIDKETAMECVKSFLETKFSAGRHQERVNKLKEMGNE